MLLFDGKKTTFDSISSLTKIGNELPIELLINGTPIRVLSKLSTPIEQSDVCLFMFGTDPQAFVSFKEKIKYCLLTKSKISFHHYPNNKEDIENGKKLLQMAITLGKKIIIQLPIQDIDIGRIIQTIPDKQDIDNLKRSNERYGCTQLAIRGLADYLIKKFNIKIVTIIGYRGFVGAGIKEGIKAEQIFLIDKQDDIFSPEYIQEVLTKTELLISTASQPLVLPNNITSNISIIDAGFIRGGLGTRGSISYKMENMHSMQFLTPVPGGIGPLEMLFMIGKIKNIPEVDIFTALNKNIKTHSCEGVF